MAERTPQIVGMLLQDATATRLNVHDCDHLVNVTGDYVTVAASFCHDLTDADVVHADRIQDTGGHDGTTIRGNASFSRDTSDVLLGQERGDGSNYLMERNLFPSIGTPPPSYLPYLSGKNNTVRDNTFVLERTNGVGGYTYGYCTEHQVVRLHLDGQQGRDRQDDRRVLMINIGYVLNQVTEAQDRTVGIKI